MFIQMMIKYLKLYGHKLILTTNVTSLMFGSIFFCNFREYDIYLKSN